MCLAVSDGKCGIARLVYTVHGLQEAVLKVQRLKGHGLKIGLLADTEGELCELYGTWGERKFMGKTYMGIGRSTFVIDKQGKLIEVNYKVKARGHAQAILELVQALD